jgi:ribosomal protein L29
MKKEEFSALVSLSVKDLNVRLKAALADLLKIRMSVKTGQEKNTAKCSFQKKYVAQLRTAIRLKEISEVVV